METESSASSVGLDKLTHCRPRRFHFIGVTESNIWIYYSNCTQYFHITLTAVTTERIDKSMEKTQLMSVVCCYVLCETENRIEHCISLTAMSIWKVADTRELADL